MLRRAARYRGAPRGRPQAIQQAEQPSRLLKPVRIVRTHNRLFAAIALGIVVYLLLPGSLLPGGWKLPTRILIGWNSGVLIYLAIAAFKVARFDLKVALLQAARRRRRLAGAVLTIAASAASLAAVVAEIGCAKMPKR